MLPRVVIRIIIPCRLVHSGRQMTALSGNEVLTFGLRSGTRQGVEAHTFAGRDPERPVDLDQSCRTSCSQCSCTNKGGVL